jgi:hypothetical protein
MKQKEKGSCASICEGYHCKDCGWPVIDACCNDRFTEYKDAAQWDWWMYCSNKGCKNHVGEGVFQIWPDWIEKDS